MLREKRCDAILGWLYDGINAHYLSSQADWLRRDDMRSLTSCWFEEMLWDILGILACDNGMERKVSWDAGHVLACTLGSQVNTVGLLLRRGRPIQTKGTRKNCRRYCYCHVMLGYMIGVWWYIYQDDRLLLSGVPTIFVIPSHHPIFLLLAVMIRSWVGVCEYIWCMAAVYMVNKDLLRTIEGRSGQVTTLTWTLFPAACFVARAIT